MNCLECNGECCKRLAIDIDEPEDEEDLEDLKWYLYHKGVSVYVDEEGDWCVQFETRCKNLNKKNLCEIYDKRPAVCRKYPSEKCEMNNENDCTEYFQDIKDVDKYIEKMKREGKLVDGKIKKNKVF